MTAIADLLYQAIIDCGSIARKHHNRLFAGTGVGLQYKSDETPVTATDLEINRLMGEFAKRNDLGYIAEEGNGVTDRKLVLLVDPIDGTGAFMRGMNTATIIATIMRMENGHGTPILSMIHEPLSGKTWTGEPNSPTTFHDGRVNFKPRASAFSKKHRANICVFPGASHKLAEVKAHIENHNDFTQQDLGGFGISAGLIASGILDVAAIGATSAVESAAMMLIVNGAGGISHDLDGKPLRSFKLGKVRGKIDFELPQGALFAGNKYSATAVSSIISSQS